MNFDGLLRDLGAVRHAPLREQVLALDAGTWRENRVRQESFDVHRQTESVVLLFIEVDEWPRIVVRREAGWKHLGEAAMALADDVVRAHFDPGGIIVRAVMARIGPGARIMPHTDTHPSFHYAHRVHIPLVTSSRVRFTVAGKPCTLAEGHAYEINNQKPHSVMNNGRDGRIHFIFDYVPPDRFRAGGDGYRAAEAGAHPA